MSVDCRIRLPHFVTVREIGSVIAALAGTQYEGHEDGGSSPIMTPASGSEVRFESMMFPGSATVHFNEMSATPDQGDEGRYIYVHFDGVRNGMKHMLPPSTAFWIAVGARLVSWFGGKLQYQDGNDKFDVVTPPAKSVVGRWWNKDPHVLPSQERQRLIAKKAKFIASVVPLHPDEVRQAAPMAAYPDKTEEAIAKATRTYALHAERKLSTVAGKAVSRKKKKI